MTIPITFIQAAKTITVTYVGTAPSTASADATQLIIKSRGTSSGNLAVITNKGVDPVLNYYPIAVGKAANGSGLVGVDVTTVAAGSTGNIFNITYKAIGQLDGGKIKISRPTGWTAIEANISANSTKVTLDAVVSTEDIAVYKITTLGKDEQITFTYSGVTVPTDRSIDNVIGFQVTNFNDDTDTYAAVTTNLSDTLVVPSAITIDYAADGSGTLAITESGTTTAVTTQASLKFAELDISYTPFAEMLNGKIVLTIPAGWSAPVKVATATSGINVVVASVSSDDWAVDATAMTVTISDIDLDESSTLKIDYTGRAPSVGGASIFSLTSQGHIDDAGTEVLTDDTNPTGRGLVAVGSGVNVNIANVESGRGKAGIIYPVTQSAGADTEATTDDFYKREFLKGTTNERIEFSFEAVGPTSGAEVQFQIDRDYVTALGSDPQTTNSAGVAYASVTSAPAGSYTGLDLSPVQEKYLQLTGVTLTAGQKIEVTLANLSFPQQTVYSFPTYMRYGAQDPWAAGNDGDSDALATYYSGFDLNNLTNGLAIANYANEDLPLYLNVLSVEGKGTLAITPSTILRHGTVNNFQLQFTAAAATGAIRIDLNSNISAPIISSEAAPKSTSDPGFVRIEQGTGVLAVDTINRTITVKELSLVAGQTITVGYYQATFTGNGDSGVGAVVFNGNSTSDASASPTFAGAGMPIDSVPTVYFVSDDGIGMVTTEFGNVIDGDNAQRQPVMNGNGTKAGSSATIAEPIDFYYRLADNQYIRNGGLELIVPVGWTAPTKGTNAERKIDVAYNSGVGGAFVALVEADWGSKITVNGQSIIVAIDVMTSIYSLKFLIS